MSSNLTQWIAEARDDHEWLLNYATKTLPKALDEIERLEAEAKTAYAQGEIHGIGLQVHNCNKNLTDEITTLRIENVHLLQELAELRKIKEAAEAWWKYMCDEAYGDYEAHHSVSEILTGRGPK